MLCVRIVLVAKKLMDKTEGVSDFPSIVFLCQRAEKFCSGTL